MCVWCQEFLSWITEQVWTPVIRWVTDVIQRCSRQSCIWWCLCCNIWFCWLVAIIVAIIVLIVTIILILIAIIVCIACYIPCLALCIIFWIFQQTPINNCIDWCNTGKLAPWETEPRVDPQPPLDDPTLTPGGVSGDGLKTDDGSDTGLS